jgi:hypothetical protein
MSSYDESGSSEEDDDDEQEEEAAVAVVEQRKAVVEVVKPAPRRRIQEDLEGAARSWNEAADSQLDQQYLSSILFDLGIKSSVADSDQALANEVQDDEDDEAHRGRSSASSTALCAEDPFDIYAYV